MFQKLRKQLAHIFRNRRDSSRLAITDEDVVLSDKQGEVWRFRWDAVDRIETYKRDLGVVDTICLDFTVQSQRSTLTTNDQMVGFDILCKELTGHFPAIAEDWWLRVAFPAFETNFAVLFERPTS